MIRLLAVLCSATVSHLAINVFEKLSSTARKRGESIPNESIISCEHHEKAILTIGIAASGKSTWAAQYCGENERAIEINCEYIRKCLYTMETGKPFTWDKWNWKSEREVTLTQREMIERAAKNPHVGTIISDTNLNANRIKEMREWPEDLGFEVEYKVFRVDYEEAVNRDAKRKGDSVGPLMIERQLEYFNELMKTFKWSDDVQ
jgi:predicted kinase